MSITDQFWQYAEEAISQAPTPNQAKTRSVNLSLHGLGRERRYKRGALLIATARPRVLDYNKRSTVKVTLSKVASFSKTRGCAD
jgi:hypothetical protein